MIIDLDHPVAPHILVLKDGLKMPRVLLVDTELKTAKQACFGGIAPPGTEVSVTGQVSEVPYDSLAFGSNTPPHIRDLLPEVPLLTGD